jgi:hypothetical protein
MQHPPKVCALADHGAARQGAPRLVARLEPILSKPADRRCLPNGSLHAGVSVAPKSNEN